MSAVVVFALALVSAAPNSPPAQASGSAPGSGGPLVDRGAPLFTRDEPHLAAGARALRSGDPDLALERFRKAETETDDERAVVEYDAGMALLAIAEATVAPAAQNPLAGGAHPGPAAPSAPAGPPTPPDVSDALAALERAAGLAQQPRLQSEARLAAGTVALAGQKLDDAIAQFRLALVADPSNERARRNLQRALQLKQQQPPPQDQDGDGEKGDKGDQQEPKDGDKQSKDGDGTDGEGQPKPEGEGEGDTQEDDSDEDTGPDDDKKEQDDEQKDQEGSKADDQENKKKEEETEKKDQGKKDQGKNSDEAAPKDKDGKGDDGAGGKKPKKPTSKEEAQRLLDGVRSRERPLTPMEMRGATRSPPAGGKDW